METTELLAQYVAGHDMLKKQLSVIPHSVIFFKPEKSWSIAEIIVHLADAEAMGFVCARKIIAESGGKVCVYNQQIWADKLHYGIMDHRDALEHIRIIRKNLYKVLKLIPDKTWENYIYHPEGGKLTLHDWLRSAVDHFQIHMEQMRQNYSLWQKAKDTVTA